MISLAIILPIRYFLVQPFYVKGASMEPNFVDHDYLLIDEISYRFYEPTRGDVIVFRYPRDRKQFFIKRIVGLPGERVQIKNGQVFVGPVNSEVKQLEETYLPAGVVTQGRSEEQGEVNLQAGQYYVLGDNRPASLDSRAFGPVATGDIIGRIWVRGWPWERWTVYNGSTSTTK